jgi:hypothetical protein
MSARLLRLLFVLALFTLAGGSAPAGGQDDKVQAVRDAVAAGRPVVLALAQELPTGDGGDETDADWAHYLNEFAAGHEGYEIVAIDAAEAAALLAAPPPLENYYATIFVRSPKSAIIYDGPVLETAVYKAGASYLDATGDDAFDAEIFAPYAFTLK